MHNYKKITILALVAAVGIYITFSIFAYLFRDKTEEIRQERYHEAEDQVNSYSGQIQDLQKKIDDLQIRKAEIKSCMEANSHTGTLVNCGISYILKAQAEEIKIEKKEVVKMEAKIEKQTGSQWLVNKDGESKKREELLGNTFEEISKNSGISPDYWYDAERKWKVKKEVALCIAWADSGLGKELKSTNNIGNVGNNDRGDVVHYKTQQSGVEAIFRVLNNNYLKHKQSIGSLSVGGGGSSPYYATSPDNWDKNTRNCLSVIHGQEISKDFKIRL